MFGIVPDIDKKFVLDRLSQEEIFEKYLGVSVVYTERFISPLRDDSTPTCSFKMSELGIIWFKDWSGHFYGDCFSVVQHVYNCSFYEACRKIAYDFQLVDGLNLGKNFTKKPKEYGQIQVKEVAEIKVKWGVFSDSDLSYWTDHGVKLETLSVYQTGVVEYAWVNKSLVYSRLQQDPCYGYYFEEGILKLYFPKREDRRFLSNHKGLQGYKQLPSEGRLLIITKSLKDVMFFYQMGIAAVSPPSESSILTKVQFEELDKRFSYIISMYDFDLTGIRGANKMKRAFGIAPHFITNGRFNTPNYGGKDVTGLCKLVGKDRAIDIINEIIW